MQRLLPYLILIVCFDVAYSAERTTQNHFYYFGNGSPLLTEVVTTLPDGSKSTVRKADLDEGMFVDGFKAATRMDRRFWKTHFSYTQESRLPRSELNRLARQEVNDFTRSELQSQLKKIDSDLASGVLGRGSQVLIAFHTHGYSKSGKHEVSITKDGDFDYFEPALLKDLLQRAKAKGVKVAVLDLSCSSGRTLELADDDICVITGAGKDSMSYDYNAFFQQMKASSNLEEAYEKTLHVQKEKGSPSSPLISNEASRVASALVAQTRDALIKALDEAEANIKSENAALNCSLILKPLDELKHVFAKLVNHKNSGLAQFAKSRMVLIEKAKRLIENLKSQREKLHGIETTLNSACKVELVCAIGAEGLYYHEESIKEEAKGKPVVGTLAHVMAVLNSEEFKKYKSIKDAESNLQGEVMETIEAINLSYRADYYHQYHAMKKANSKQGGNACRNFKLR